MSWDELYGTPQGDGDEPTEPFLIQSAWVKAPRELTGSRHLYAGLVVVTAPDGRVARDFLRHGAGDDAPLVLKQSVRPLPFPAHPKDRELMDLAVRLINTLTGDPGA